MSQPYIFFGYKDKPSCLKLNKICSQNRPIITKVTDQFQTIALRALSMWPPAAGASMGWGECSADRGWSGGGLGGMGGCVLSLFIFRILWGSELTL